MIIRQIEKKDIETIWELLNQLMFVDTSRTDLELAWKKFNNHGMVVEVDDKIVGFGCLVVEYKIRGYTSGHIEDVVIDEEWRGCGVGVKLIKALCEKAEEYQCYRVSLFCREELVPFYNKNGFEINNVVMKKFFNQ